MKKIIRLPLVNAHTHAAMIAFRGLAEDLPLKQWLEENIWPMEREKVSPGFVYKNTKKAILEMQKNGIQAFCNMYFFEDEAARAAEELKMHAILGEAIIDFPTPSCQTPEEAFEIIENQLKKYQGHQYVKIGVIPHSIYTVCEDNLLKAKRLAKKYDAIFHIHLAETQEEFETCQEKNGVTPVGYLEKLGILDEKTILAHCVWVTDEDIDILARRKVNVAHCPLSNLKLGSGIAPIHKMIKKGVNVALGTDGAASSNRLDIWEAGKFAVLLQKGITEDPAVLTTKQAIEMMTVNGLKALGIKEINGKNIPNIQNEIDKIKKLDLLYSHHINELA